MLPVYVMIGGGSRRFGQDKASCPVDGEPWALHVGRRFSNGAEPVLVGRDRPGGRLADSLWVADDEEAEGPIAGILAALSHRLSRHGDGLLVLTACDLVRPEAVWLESLVAAHDSHPDLEAAAYYVADRWQPFPSVAHTRWLPKLRQVVADGVRSLQAALDAANHVSPAWPGEGTGPAQANTREELTRLLRN